MLLVWLIGIGAGSALLAAWIFAEVVAKQRLGIGALFSGFGLYVGLFGASGPTVLWLAGRAQGHSLKWFAWTAAKMGLVMIGIVIVAAVFGRTGGGSGCSCSATLRWSRPSSRCSWRRPHCRSSSAARWSGA
jgi:hypothetical protein